MRRQKAVWWKRLTPDEFGVFTFDDPVEIDCRWDDCVKSFDTMKGETLMSTAVVYVDREMSVGDRLKKGEFDSNTPDDPLADDTAYEIQRFDINPNFRNTENLLTAYIGGKQSYATA